MSCGERLAAELRKHGFRVTPQRAVILETIAHRGGHLTVQEVYAEARQRLPGLNIATIYRTVESLHHAGMVDLFSTTSHATMFELRDPANPHGHLICTICERVIEMELGLIQELGHIVASETEFELDAHHLTLFGVCARCREQ
jgi:Fe2+ or Zn2+ uptake regulation protein